MEIDGVRVDLRRDHVWATAKATAAQSFRRWYGREPQYVVAVPGRVGYWAAGPVVGTTDKTSTG